MIVGDPYKFAIIVEYMPAWNIGDIWHNGVMLLSINGELLFDEIRTITLNSNLNEFIRNIKRLETDWPVDTTIYKMKKEDTFNQMYGISFPSDFDIPNNYRHRISTYEMEDDNCYIFAVVNYDNI